MLSRLQIITPATLDQKALINDGRLGPAWHRPRLGSGGCPLRSEGRSGVVAAQVVAAASMLIELKMFKLR